MSTFTLIFVANCASLAITVAAAIKSPVGSHILIAAISLCACLSSLYQVLTGDGTIVATIFTFVLVALMLGRIALNRARAPHVP
jgi:hypothetical protein